MDKGKMQEQKKVQPISVDFYNLDLNDENAVDTFISELAQRAVPLLGVVNKNEKQEAVQLLHKEQPLFKRMCDKIIRGEKWNGNDLDEINRRIFRFHPFLMSQEEDWTEELIQGSFILQPPYYSAESDFILFYRWFPTVDFTFSTIILYAYWDLVYYLLSGKAVIKRCECRRCDKIFHQPKKAGMPRRYCSKKCCNYENTRKRRDKGGA